MLGGGITIRMSFEAPHLSSFRQTAIRMLRVGGGDRIRMVNGCNSCAANVLGEGVKRLGVSWECANGISGQDLSLVVKDPDLYRVFKAWGQLKPKLRDAIASLVDMALDDCAEQ